MTLFLLCLSQATAFAQVGKYGFGLTTVTYSNLTGTTTLMGTNVDEQISAATNIGFTFWFNGQSYTQFAVSSNGFMNLGGPASGPLPTNNLTTVSGVPFIAPFWDNLKTGTNSGDGVYYKTEGTAPNRKLSVEWRGMKRICGTGSHWISFQAILYETTGNIEFRYNKNANTNCGSDPGSIGLAVPGGQFLSFNGNPSPVIISSVTEQEVFDPGGLKDRMGTWTPVSVASDLMQVSKDCIKNTGANVSLIRANFTGTTLNSGVVLGAISIDLSSCTNFQDIDKIRVYSSGSSASRNPSDPMVGEVTVASSAAITFSLTGTNTLAVGNNYYWFEAVLKTTATTGNLFDMAFTQIIFHTPLVFSTSNPSGSNELVDMFTYCTAGSDNGKLISSGTGGQLDYNITVDASMPDVLSYGANYLQDVQLSVTAAAGANMSAYTAKIVAPDGSSYVLMNSGNGGNNVFNFKTTYRESAVLNYSMSSIAEPWTKGFYKPNDNWEGLSGLNPAGTWQVKFTESTSAEFSMGTVKLVFSSRPAETAVSGNDNISDAYTIRTDGIYTGTTAGATIQTGLEPLTGGWSALVKRTVWFRFTASGTTAKISVSGQDLITQAQLMYSISGNYTGGSDWGTVTNGCPCAAGNGNGSLYDQGATQNFVINATGLTPGNVYYLAVDGNGTAGTGFYIDILGVKDVAPELTLTTSSTTGLQYTLSGAGLPAGPHSAGTSKFTPTLPVAGDFSNVELNVLDPADPVPFLRIRFTVDSEGDVSDLVMINDADAMTGEYEMPVPTDAYKVTGGGILFISTFETLEATLGGGGCLTHPYYHDADRNFVYEKVIGDNNAVGEKTVYIDGIGREDQTQIRNTESDRIIATDVIYDAWGRPAIQTLPAPTGTQCWFDYNGNFTGDYRWPDFDKPVVSGLPGEVNNPLPVTSGDLTDYYSDLNTNEPFIPETDFPYVRAEFYKEGGLKRIASPGEVMRMGNGHEFHTATMPVQEELDHYISWRKLYVTTDENVSLDMDASKTITRDENGGEFVEFRDRSGHVVATCLAGRDAPQSITVSYSSKRYELEFIAQGNGNNDPGGFGVVTITNLTRYNKKAGVDLSVSGSYAFVQGHSYRVESATGEFLLNFINSYPSKCRDYIDIHLTQGQESSLSATGAGTINVESRMNEKIIYSGTAAGIPTGLPYGYYRIWSNKAFTVTHRLNYYSFQYHYYDMAGQHTATVQPNGVDISALSPTFVETTELTTTGQVINSLTPDEGELTAVYRNDGNLKFSQNADQKSKGYFTYYLYDEKGRVIETGEYRPSGGIPVALAYETHQVKEAGTTAANGTFTVINSEDGIDDARCFGVTKLNYDKPDPLFSSATGLSVTDWRQRNMIGRLSMATTNDTRSWYSYDTEGNNVWDIRKALQLGVITQESSYFFPDQVRETKIQKGITAQRFFQEYHYNKNFALSRVYSTGKILASQIEAKYLYNLIFQNSRKEIGGNVQGVDYVYDLTGKIKSVNHPELDNNDPGGDGFVNSFKKDIFSYALEYFRGDYVRTGSGVESDVTTTQDQFDGKIRAERWNTRGTNPSPDEMMYDYFYDHEGRLVSATFGYYDAFPGIFTPAAGDYLVEGIEYDPNGNIKKYLRNAYLPALDMDDIRYDYASGTNRLTEIEDGATPVTDPYGGLVSTSASNYQYSLAGRLVKETDRDLEYEYTNRGQISRVKDVSTGLPVLDIMYDEFGNRLRLREYSAAGVLTNTIFYIHDGAGNQIAVYSRVPLMAVRQREVNMLGKDRIGVVYRQTVGPDNYNYEFADHRGNIRATAERNYISGTVPVSWSDYYPWGWKMPNRQLVSAYAERYGHQGEEHYNLLDWDMFSAGMYDARIGRWWNPVPSDFKGNPYTFAGNNSVSFVVGNSGMAAAAHHLSAAGETGWNMGTICSALGRENHQSVMTPLLPNPVSVETGSGDVKSPVISR